LFTQLVSKIFNVCGHDPPTSQTDRWTHDMRSQDRALHYSAPRGNGNEAIVDTRFSLAPVCNKRCVLASLYRWAKFGWNLGCCSYRILSPLRNKHGATEGRCVKLNVIHKTGSTRHIATLSQKDRVTTTGNTHSVCSLW